MCDLPETGRRLVARRRFCPRNWALICPLRWKTKKRDTLERMSPYMALSREGRLKNRGRPWPREREGPNVVGRDLVFQPSLPATTY